jgi:hypothetical protein
LKRTDKYNLSITHPHLIDEWHPTKNGDLTPFNITFGSGKKVWWICDKGHEFETYIKYRTVQSSGCPICSHHKVGYGNDLETQYPKIAKQWHPTKNGDLKPNKVVVGKRDKVWWVCEKGHEWDTTIQSRVNGVECYYCCNRKVGYGNDLETQYPKIVKQWHPTKNGDLKPNQFLPNSTKKVWWICKNGHEHDKPIRRIVKGIKCLYCINKKISSDNNLLTRNPKISKEWHPTKNGDLTPFNITFGSGKKVWWICDKGHEWKTTIVHRTRNKSGCPKCFPFFSKIELQFYSEIKYLFPSTLSSYKIKNIEIDIFIEELNLGIEYDGVYYHSNKIEKDKKKNKRLKKLGIDIFRIREKPLKKISVNDVITSGRFSVVDLTNVLKKIVLLRKNTDDKIKKYIDGNKLKNKRYYNQLLKKFPNPINPLSETHPATLKLWNYEKNKNIKPHMVSYGSTNRVWWICNKGHEWEGKILTISHRKGSGCPYCQNKKVGYGNDLQSVNPKLAEQWNYEKNNELLPNEILPKSGKKVWWKCDNGHEWEQTPSYRTRAKVCPICKKLKLVKYPYHTS